MQAAPSASTRSTAASPTAAVDQFLKAVQADQPEVAYRLLTTADQHTFATAAAFAGVLANEPSLTGFRVRTNAPLSAPSGQSSAPPSGVKHSVAVELEFTPAVDSIVGVVAPTASAIFDIVSEPDGWRVAWTKRRIEPAYAAESRVIDDITTWAKSRQSCSGALNESPELTGVVGLASALCNTKTPLKLDPVVSGFDDVDDPQPVLDTFGGQAPNWARVVTVEAPIKMRVVAAPLGDHWIAVAVDRVSPSQ